MIKMLRRWLVERQLARAAEATAALPHGEAKAKALTAENALIRKARALGSALALVLIACLASASTCTQPVIDTGKHCAKVAGSGVVNDILPRVNAVLGCSISDPAAIPACVGSGLADLGVQFGIDFVLCALEQIESRKFVTPGDPDVGVRQRRAKAYLEARKEQAGICAGCGAKLASTNDWSLHWSLPFEDHTPNVTVSASRQPGKCSRGMHALILPPYPAGKVCVTDDFTFDVDISYPPLPPAETYVIDGPPVRLLEI
jgi:hypothetical protein